MEKQSGNCYNEIGAGLFFSGVFLRGTSRSVSRKAVIPLAVKDCGRPEKSYRKGWRLLMENTEKKITELKFEDLTLEQKLGMVLIGGGGDFGIRDENLLDCLELIKKHALGGIWIDPREPHYEEHMRLVHETADYPLLIFTDAESGMAPYLIGYPIALSYTNDERLAYLFGKVTAVTARRAGFTTVCNPVLDMTDRNVPCGGTVRVMGSDKKHVASFAKAICQGMHDAGVLTVGKHYPSVAEDADTHMSECVLNVSEEKLLDYHLYSYLELMKAGLLDGVMTGHKRLANIDNEFPVSLSAKVNGILRKQGFEGLMLTDALTMMGIVSRFGRERCKSLAISGGNDLALVWSPIKPSYEEIKRAYEAGEITPERLDEAVKRVLRAQHAVFTRPEMPELTEEEIEEYMSINRRCIAGISDPGLTPALDPAGHYQFVILTEGNVNLKEIDVATFAKKWYNPAAIAEKIREQFPHSDVTAINEFPSANENYSVLQNSIDYDGTVIISFTIVQAYLGRETYTSRLMSLIEALQTTNRIAAIVHFGNPFLLEELPHVPRILNGCLSAECTLAAIEMLAGKEKPTGRIPYDIHLK